MASRLSTALTRRTPVAIALLSAVLALALLLLPSLEPWRERAIWVVAWGVGVAVLGGLVSARPRAPGATPPDPLPESPSLASAPVIPPASPHPPLPSHQPSPPQAEPYPDRLTRREVEVLRLIAAGNTNRQIAASLFVSVPTAERHIANIYSKIGARGRADATAYAIRHGLAD